MKAKLVFIAGLGFGGLFLTNHLTAFALGESNVSGAVATEANQLLEEKLALERQQEVLVKELLRLKKKLQQSANLAIEGAGDTAPQDAELSKLRKDLENEKTYSRKLEEQIVAGGIRGGAPAVDNGRIQILESSNTELKQELSSTRAEVEQLRGRLNQEIGILERRKSELERKNEHLDTEVVSYEQKRQDMNEQIAVLSRENKAYALEMVRLREGLEKKEEVESNSQRLSTELRNMQDEVVRLSTEMSKLEKANASFKQSVDTLQVKLNGKESLLVKTGSDLEKIKKDNKEASEELESTKRQLSKAVGEVKTLSETVKAFAAQKEKYSKTEGESAQVRQQLTMRQSELQTCQVEKTKADQRMLTIQEMEKRLIARENDILMREKEFAMNPKAAVKRLERASLSHGVPNGTAAAKQAQQVVPTIATTVAPSPASDIMIVEVTSNKVNVRSGPGDEHSPIMQISQGARLTVEDVEGEWYRVFTPQGSRGYIRRDVVRPLNEQASSVAGDAGSVAVPQKPVRRLGAENTADANQLEPFGSVRVGGNGMSVAEAKAFERIKSGIGKKEQQLPPPTVPSVE